ncbi:MAG TPA: YceI family protein [Mucilaginibacter sp.]|nr:YceI family protein [Mucilaginibacter sp.]
MQGSILFDPVQPGKMFFDVSIDANSVNTGNDMRDNHLRESTYFDVKKYPLIHFVSSKVTASATKGIFMI